MTIPTGLIIAAVNLTGTISFTLAPSNLIDNGTFDSDAGWTLGGGAAISGGKLTFSGADGTAVRNTNAAITEGSFYSVAFDVLDQADPAGVSPSLGGTAGTFRDSDGSFSEHIRAGATQEFLLTGSTSNVISVDNVVVTGPIETPLNTELVGNQTFDSAAGVTLGGANPMTISGGTLNAVGGTGTKTANQSPSGYPLTVGTYRVVFDVTSYTNGTAFASLPGGVNGTGRTAIGTYSEDLVVSDTSGAQTIGLNATSGSNLSMDNFSVKRIA